MNATQSSVHINIVGATAADALAAARALGGTTDTSALTNDALLAELRDRFAKLVPPMVIRVLPFESEAGGVSGTTNDNAGKAPTAAEKKAAEKLAKEAAKAATDAALKEAAKGTVAGTQTAGADVAGATEAGGDDWDGSGDDTATELTADDVKAALNACSTKNGQAATREIMKEKGGSMRLLDIDKAKYPALVEALKAA